MCNFTAVSISIATSGLQICKVAWCREREKDRERQREREREREIPGMEAGYFEFGSMIGMSLRGGR